MVLGAGFGGLELTALLSDALGDRADLDLIDQSDAFVFGFSKLDLMFGGETPDAIRHPYRRLVRPGVRFHQERVTAIDPAARRVTTDLGRYEADYLVIALGADYDVHATPGLSEIGDDFYTVDGADRLRTRLERFTEGHAVVGVCSAPFKCPPAPSEAALLLHDYLVRRGARDRCTIQLVMPLPMPIPVSPTTSRAVLRAFADRGIEFRAGRSVRTIERDAVTLDDGSRLPCDLFFGVPKHVVPDVLRSSGLIEHDWVAVNPTSLVTKFPGVYAVGDVTNLEVPMAGLFAEGGARTVAASILAELVGGPPPAPYDGAGACYVEFGGGKVGKTDVDFLSGPAPSATFHEPSDLLAAEKRRGGEDRITRWFGR